MDSENRKRLGDYPIVVWLGIISSTIAIFAFLTGYQSLSDIVAQATSSVPVPVSTPTEIIKTVASPSAIPSLIPPPPKVQPTSTIPVSVTTIPPTIDATCFRVAFLSETIPDNTIFNPGDKFTKTWKIQNTGMCTWETGTKWVFVSGDLVAASPTVVINSSIPPGMSLNISVNFIAPSQPGNYKSDWILENTQGTKFGFGDNQDEPLWVQIKVQN